MSCCMSAELVGDVKRDSRFAGIALDCVGANRERGRNRESS